MGFYRDTGVVLRLQKLGEADRIVTFLTHRHGKVRAVAKGVRRTSSRFGARLEPFGHVDLQLHTGRSLDVVTQVQTLDAFGGDLTGDYPRYTAGCALLETADRLTSEEGEPARELFLLLVGALRGLAGGSRDPYLVLDAFLLRAMVIAGWAPAITECARCGSEGAPYHRRFSVPAGGAVCEPCRPSGAVVPSEPTWRLLEALRDGDWSTAEGTDAAARRDTAGLVAAHLQWHLERTLRSLPLVDRRGGVPRVDLAAGAGLEVDDLSEGTLRSEEPAEGAPRRDDVGEHSSEGPLRSGQKAGATPEAAR
ncbi:DNA repair protein RecO [Actinomycetospora lemnae]|uniref:DNA repair protein RecO n=1 Tax=Actinomycetospora lemnae TaxID=3019891 RepID=A0ABT5SWK2_9PSEU|nr:DNA repair protein RecO [Actinomycetospora sp. DW7H6]MDD7967101.1 DNA repair protein RecO [Actinomycetospora sp. DW7H6]